MCPRGLAYKIQTPQKPWKTILDYKSISVAVEDEEVQEYLLSLIRSVQTQRFTVTSPAEAWALAWGCGLAPPGPQTSGAFCWVKATLCESLSGSRLGYKIGTAWFRGFFKKKKRKEKGLNQLGKMPFESLFFLLCQYAIDFRWKALTSRASYAKWGI